MTSRDLTMSKDSAALSLISIQIPSEIISMIAEACVDSYSILMDIHVGNDNSSKQHEIMIHAKSPASRLAVTSRDFKHGIAQGIRKNFNGHLTMPDLLIEHVTEALGRRGLSWVLPKIEQIHLRVEGSDWLDIKLEPVYSQFANIKSMTMAITDEQVFPVGFTAVGGRSSHDLTREVKKILQHLKLSAGDGFVIVMKLIFPVGVARVGGSCYVNAEVQVTGSTPKLLKHYGTLDIQWGIRSSLEEDE